MFPDDLFIIGGHPAEPRKINMKEIINVQSNLIDFSYTPNSSIYLTFVLDEYPWQISLQVPRGGTWGHNCGGSIMDETTVITAAHCCYGHTAASMQVMN